MTPALASATPPRGNLPLDTAVPPTGLPPVSADELVVVLRRAGARVVSRQMHGVLLKVRRRLVFIPATSFVSEFTLTDAMRLAGLTPERFLKLRAATS